jgi:hypothetical protein
VFFAWLIYAKIHTTWVTRQAALTRPFTLVKYLTRYMRRGRCTNKPVRLLYCCTISSSPSNRRSSSWNSANLERSLAVATWYTTILAHNCSCYISQLQFNCLCWTLQYLTAFYCIRISPLLLWIASYDRVNCQSFMISSALVSPPSRWTPILYEISICPISLNMTSYW